MEKHICDSSCTHSNRPFLQLHTHTRVGSVRDCTADPAAMFDICKDNNMSFGLSDHGWASAFVEVYKNAKRTGVKPVFGVEMYLNRYRNRLFTIREKLESLKNLTDLGKDAKVNVDEEIRKLNFEFDEIKKNNHICIFAKNKHGFHNLIELHNIASLSGFYGKPLITLDEIFDAPKDKSGDRGFVVTSACLSGVIPREVLAGKYTKALDHALNMKEEFKDDFYLEIQPHELEEQRAVNLAVRDISEKTKIPICIGTDSHYLSKEYSDSHQIFLLLQGEEKVSDIGKKIWSVTYETKKGETRRKKIALGENFYTLPPEELYPGDKVSKTKGKVDTKEDFIIKKVEQVNKVWMIEGADLSFKTEHELRDHAKTFEEIKDIVDSAIETNKDIYAKIGSWDWDNDLKLPVYEDGNEKLYDLCMKGMKEKSLDKDKVYIDRFKEEFLTIKKSGLAAYFIILIDMFQYARSVEIPIGPARGSSGSSLLLYLLGITRIDPIKWDFPFARFLNEKKIDVNSERIRIQTEEGILDLKPNDEVLVAGVKKKVKDLQKNEEFELVT